MAQSFPKLQNGDTVFCSDSKDEPRLIYVTAKEVKQAYIDGSVSVKHGALSLKDEFGAHVNPADGAFVVVETDEVLKPFSVSRDGITVWQADT